MKLFSKMLSRKPEPDEAISRIDLDADLEPLRRQSQPIADDSGTPNASRDEAKKDDPLATAAARFAEAPDPAPDPAPEAEWSDEDWNDEDWDDEDWGDEWDEPATAAAPEAPQESADHLKDNIRSAVVSTERVQPEEQAAPVAAARPRPSARSWMDDEEFGRKALARNHLGGLSDGTEDRLLERTDTEMGGRETSRRRSAMAHLKAAAAATKADRVLRSEAQRDPASDPEEQSPYRDDLAKVVRPRTSTRPITRPITRHEADRWHNIDDAELLATGGDDGDVERRMEAELAAAEEERLARVPMDLSEEDFARDGDWERPADDHADELAPEAPAAVNEDLGSIAASRWGAEEDDEPQPEEAPEATAPLPEAAPEPVTEEVQTGRRKNIWDMDGNDADAAEPVADEAPATEEEAPIVEVSGPVSGRSGKSAGRVKTRLLGFQAGHVAAKDVFAGEASGEQAADVARPAHEFFPAGWLFVVEGPGRGACFTLFTGVAQIGRGEGQPIRLDFGDTSISRNNHAAVAFDEEQGKFFLGHGGKSNLVRLNGTPVLSTEEMSDGDEIRIGETTLRFKALCGADFQWNQTEGDDAGNAADA